MFPYVFWPFSMAFLGPQKRDVAFCSISSCLLWSWVASVRKDNTWHMTIHGFMGAIRAVREWKTTSDGGRPWDSKQSMDFSHIWKGTRKMFQYHQHIADRALWVYKCIQYHRHGTLESKELFQLLQSLVVSGVCSPLPNDRPLQLCHQDQKDCHWTGVSGPWFRWLWRSSRATHSDSLVSVNWGKVKRDLQMPCSADAITSPSPACFAELHLARSEWCGAIDLWSKGSSRGQGESQQINPKCHHPADDFNIFQRRITMWNNHVVLGARSRSNLHHWGHPHMLSLSCSFILSSSASFGKRKNVLGNSASLWLLPTVIIPWHGKTTPPISKMTTAKSLLQLRRCLLKSPRHSPRRHVWLVTSTGFQNWPL